MFSGVSIETINEYLNFEFTLFCFFNCFHHPDADGKTANRLHDAISAAEPFQKLLCTEPLKTVSAPKISRNLIGLFAKVEYGLSQVLIMGSKFHLLPIL